MSYSCSVSKERAHTINLSRRNVTFSRSHDVTLPLIVARTSWVIREFDPSGELPFRRHRSEIYNRETCESNPRGTAMKARKKMRIRVALSASNHVAAFSIYLSSRNRKEIHFKFIAAFVVENLYWEKGERAEGKVASFLSHEMRVSGACHGVMLRINLSDKGVENTRMIRRTSKLMFASWIMNVRWKEMEMSFLCNVIFMRSSHELCITFRTCNSRRKNGR